MECKSLHKKSIFFLEKELPAKEMEEIQLHLIECSECSLFFEEMKKTFNIIELEKSPVVNPFFYTHLKAKLENETTNTKRFLCQPVFTKILQPAFFSVILVFGVYTGFKIGQPEHARNIAFSYTEQEYIPYLNEMNSEPIETFLME